MFMNMWVYEVYHYSSDYAEKRNLNCFHRITRKNGTLTAFLGLLTDFKRKLDLAVVAIPPKAGMRMR